jgi:hypothetical protein
LLLSSCFSTIYITIALDRSNVYIIGTECAGMTGINQKPAAGCDDCKVRIPPLYNVLIKNPDINSTDFTAAVKNILYSGCSMAPMVIIRTGYVNPISSYMLVKKI